MAAQEVFVHVVAYQVLRGLRGRLTIAGQVGRPIEADNDLLCQLQAACDGCIELTPVRTASSSPSWRGTHSSALRGPSYSAFRIGGMSHADHREAGA